MIGLKTLLVGLLGWCAADAAQAVYIQLPVALLIDALIFRHFPANNGE